MFGGTTFTTHTTKKEREGVFTAALHVVHREYSIRRNEWFIRHELGTDATLSPHVHFLVAGLPRAIEITQYCMRLSAALRKFGVGITEIKPYDRALDGAGYLTKRPRFDENLASECDLTFSHHTRAFLWMRESCGKEASSTPTLEPEG